MNEIEVRVTATPDVQQGLRNAEQDARRGGQRIGEALEEAIERAGDGAADAAEQAGERAGREFADGVEEEAQDGVGTGQGGGLAGKLKPMLAAGFLAAGAAAGAALMKGVEGALRKADLRATLAAQMGDSKDAARAGTIAGRVFAKGFGRSAEDAATAARLAIRLGVAGTDKEVEKVTRAALSLNKAFKFDVNETLRAANTLVRTGLAKDGPAAMDLIAKSAQATGDVSGDLLDTMTEYSTQFRDLGLTGPQAMGMIQQAMNAGARDTDFAADAIKEFAIRSKDMSTTSRDAYKSLGFNADKMFQTFAKGGPGAAKAMGDVLERLKAIKDPAEKDAVAVALFGTKAEDLQDALYAMNPETAVKALGDVGGAADKMGDTLAGSPMQKIEAFKRQVSAKFSDMAAGAISFLEKIGNDESFKQMSADLRKDVLPALQKLGNFLSANLVPFLKDVFRAALEGARRSFRNMKNAIEDNRPELERLLKNAQRVAEFVLQKLGPVVGKFLVANLEGAGRALSAVIRIAGATVRAWDRLSDGASSVARGVRRSLDRLADGAESMGRRFRNATSRLFGYIIGPIDRAVQWARSKLGELVSAARGVADRVRNAVSGALESLPGFAHGGITGAATGGARSGLIQVGEHGRELIRVPAGSRVYNNAETERMMSSSGSADVTWTVQSAGNPLDDFIVELIRRYVTINAGGSVQRALGRL